MPSKDQITPYIAGKLPWLLVIAAILVCVLGGCNGAQRQVNYDNAMREAVTQIRSGDLDQASSNLATAGANANGKHQLKKVEDMNTLLSGAAAYRSGNRDQAGQIWSGADVPEFKRALVANERSLGVSIKSTNNGENK